MAAGPPQSLGFALVGALLIVPMIAIVLSIAFNLLGDGLRDALDPRLNR